MPFYRRHLKLSFWFLALALAMATAEVSSARDVGPKETGLTSSEKPKEFEGMGIEEKLGVSLPMNLKLIDEQGNTRELGSFFSSKKPTVLSFVYFNCPSLCSLHLNGVFDALKQQRFLPGKDFEYLVVSFNSKDEPMIAAAKKESYLKQYGYEDAAISGGIHFLTADEETIKTLTGLVGFSFKWLEEEKEWAHASAAIFITPEGQVSRYLHGVFFDPKNVEMALGEVGQGKLGSIVDQLVWYCFKYDPHQSKYTIYAVRLMKIGALLMILVLAGFLVPFWLRNRGQMA